LATIDRLDDSFLMMNGDVLTALDYAHLVDVHRESGNALTIASHRRVVRTEYGVIHLDGNAGETRVVTGFEEKPELPYIVSMGVYVLQPEALKYIKANQRLDLPDLVTRLLGANVQVGAYVYDGYWLDIGRHEDYEKAILEFEQVKPLLMDERAPDEAPIATRSRPTGHAPADTIVR
jgi:NDP-sugar pyrophosphorylase family protein